MIVRVSAQNQRGVAVVSAMLTVALVAIVVSGLLLREHVTLRSVENQLALTQTRWVERAAIDWSKVILSADARTSGADHLGEAWAVAVEETRLDETVTAGARIDDDSRAATLTGQIFDAQARFNLNSMVSRTDSGSYVVNPQRIAIFSRLLEITGVPASLAAAIAARILAAKPSNAEGASPVAVLPLVRASDLLSVRGVELETIDVLEPFISFLPSHDTKINLNTAPAEVLAAVFEDLPLAEARQLVSKRKNTFYKSIGDFSGKMLKKPDPFPGDLAGVSSNFFLVRGLIRFGRVESLSETLLERQSQRVVVIWQRRI